MWVFYIYAPRMEDSLLAPSGPIVFIVPYRDREPQRYFFENYMTYLMEDLTLHEDYYILFVEQDDARPFNRGAMKNIGFLVVKDMMPDTYKDAILVFHDIDTVPHKKGLLSFDPPPGTIKHHYGFEFALGGIVSMRAADFERLNGFANYWTWGFEDNLIQNRAQRKGVQIDRSNFFPLHDMRILHLNDGNKKALNKNYMYELIRDTGANGISTVRNLKYTLDMDINSVKVHCFDAEYSPWNGVFEEYDVRQGRNISAPLTKEMMLENARLGNNLETLTFLDSDGKQKTSRDILLETSAKASARARASASAGAMGSREPFLFRPRSVEAPQRAMLQASSTRRFHGMVMSNIKHSEETMLTNHVARHAQGRPTYTMRQLGALR